MEGAGATTCPGSRPQSPAPGQRREEQDTLHPGKALPDAHARAAAEREIGELRPRGLRLGAKALGIEALRIREVPRVTVRDPLARDDDRALRHGVAADFVVGERPPADDPGRRVESHRLREHHLGVREPREIRDAGRAIAENRVELLVETRLDVGILRQQVPGPGQRVGRGLVAGEKDRDRLVAHLRVGHLPAVSLGVRGAR